MPDSIKELQKQITEFRDSRDWAQFHTPKDLAISISLEAAELLELFQWTGSETEVPDKLNELKEELADIFNYCFLMADRLDLDVEQIVLDKVDKNAAKYPVEMSKGSKAKYTELREEARNK